MGNHDHVMPIGGGEYMWVNEPAAEPATIERLLAPLHVSEKTLPPHDLELYDHGGRVIARWDGDLLDEIGTREQMTANLNAVAAAFNVAANLAEWDGNSNQMTANRRDAGLMPWQIVWRDRVEKARELAAIGRGDAREDWNFSANEILAVDRDSRAKTDLWAKHGDRADAAEAELRRLRSQDQHKEEPRA